VQYSLLFFVAAVVLAFCRAWKWGMLPLMGFLLNFVPVAYYWLPAEKSDFRGEKNQKVRILVSNVFAINKRYKPLREHIRRYQPDIIGLVEVTSRWLKKLGPATRSYPHRYTLPRKDGFGLALYSKYPLGGFQKLNVGGVSVPTLVAKVALPTGVFTFVLVHLHPPKSEQFFKWRNTQLSHLAALTASSSIPVVLAGDLNTSMWSPYYRDFVSKGKLNNARKGFGLYPTWPMNSLWSWPRNPLLCVPIDHVLYTGEIHTRSFRSLGYIGSDHLPILTDLVFKKAKSDSRWIGLK